MLVKRLVVVAAVVALAPCSDEVVTVTTASGDDAPPATTSTEAPQTTSAAPVATSGAPSTSGAPTTSTPATTVPPPVPGDLVLAVAVEGLEQPVLAIAAPGDDRMFVVDQVGRVVTADGEVVLDISDRVVFEGEQGLLGIAFPADFADSGRFFVNYVAGGPVTRVSEFVSGDSGSERVLLEIDQPAPNHNGGMIAFGPDGHLWIGMGDGGGADDQFGNGQDPAVLLGGMLRIDASTEPHAIPADNPGLDGWAPEKWSIGLRNPWRFTFDGEELWIADVGQNAWEEINVVDAGSGYGSNFGWPLLEGTNCFAEDPCDASGTVLPIAEYSHDEGCSITGGFVYRGSAIPGLDGHYFYGDFCGGWIRSLVREGDGVAITEWFPPGSVNGHTGFGVDAAGELYVTTTEGTVLRIELG
ncbi:MAG: PQQ-dependent sugar dehydrogenase [Acidimicrobiia bacterium]|nr:PQQ-dependent sugar dehydrogenase [Acidimicrobiia bacterium]